MSKRTTLEKRLGQAYRMMDRAGERIDYHTAAADAAGEDITIAEALIDAIGRDLDEAEE